MMRFLRLLAVFAALPLFAQSSGTLYTIEFAGGGVAVSSVDLATGATTPVVVTDAPGANIGASAFDPIGQRFFFRSFDELYIVNLGSRTYTHVTSPDISMLAFSPTTGRLYGVGHSGGNVAVFRIDLVTGAQTPVVVTDAVGFVSGESAFDPAGQRFFFRSGSFLYTANVANGTFTRVAVEGASIEYDPVTGLLYTVASTGPSYAFYSIDPATGARTLLLTTDAPTIQNRDSAFDVAGRRFFFRTGTHLYTINVASLTFTSVPSVGSALEFATASSNIPTLSELMLAFLAIALAGLAMTRR